MADWKSLDLSEVIGAAEAGAAVGDIIQAIAAVVDTISSLLDVLKSFFVVDSDPLLAAIKVLLNQIQKELDKIQETGVFALFLTPNSLDDFAENYKGGYAEFEQKFINSLADTQDSERPQISSNGSLGGLFIFTSSGSSSAALNVLSKLKRAFNLNHRIPSYPRPINVRILPANGQGAPLERSLLSSFEGNEEPESLLLEWEEPRVANDVLLDVFSQNKFYIETAKRIKGEELNRESVLEETENPLERRKRKKNEEVKLGKDERSSSLNSFRIWEPLDESDPFVDPITDTDENSRVNFLSGSYSYHIEDVEKGIDNGKFYRIRSVPKDVELEERRGQKVLTRNGLVYRDSTPSSPVFGSLPDIDYSFDLPSAILNIYRVAYMLRMDLELEDQSGETLTGSGLVDQIIPPSVLNTEKDGIEKYILGQNSDQIAEVLIDPLFENEKDIESFGQVKKNLREDLVTDPFKFDAFGGVDEFVAPRSSLSTNKAFQLGIDRLAEERVEKLVSIVSQNDILFQVFQNEYSSIEGDLFEFLTSPLSFTEFTGEQSDLRSDVAGLIRILDGSVTQGDPPNWESITFLEDIFPQVDEIFDQLFNLIKNFDNALQNVLDDITDSIEGIQDRLEKLTSLIALIERLIDFLKSLKSILNIDLSVLWIPPNRGGNAKFIERFVNAQNKPPTNSDDYFSGIVLAPGGEDPTDFKPQSEALKFIFGV